MPDHRRLRRAPILLVLAGALIAGGLIDRAAAPHASSAAAEAVQPVPVAAPAAAYSSSWFCAGGAPGSSPAVPGWAIISNNGSRPVTATVALIGATASGGGGTSGPAGAGPSTVKTVTVAPYSYTSVPETIPGASWTGAIVDADGGAVGVSQAVDGSLGLAAAPCATSGSQHWYLPSGQTRINASETILLLNPYPTDSIVDLSFSTDQGVETPQAFEGLDVPPGGLVAVPLGTHLRRRSNIATTVSARNGNVVAWETEAITPPPKGAPLVGTPAANSTLADPAYPAAGVSLALGAPSAGTSWVWPDGLSGSGVDEQYVIYNPGPQIADVRLSVGLAHGSAEPFEISIGPYQFVQEISEQQTSIPAGTPHTATLVSTNGVPVVASRTVAALNATPSGAGPTEGTGQMLGERLSASDWMVPYAWSDANHQSAIAVYNPGTVPVRISAQYLPAKPIGAPGVSTVTIPAGGRFFSAVTPNRTGPVAIESSGPVYVESDVYGPSGAGTYSVSSAIPLS